MSRFDLVDFEVTATSGEARCGRLTLAHGVVETPIFMPVGTLGTVKGVTPADLATIGAEIVLGNTYHLFLRPGMEVVEQLGGLHRFMGWSGPILTDSGGYQVFSLKALRSIDDQGVVFKSHLDGSEHRFTPESVIATQETIGSDIMMAFDECPPLPATREYLQASLARTTAWAKRCLEARTRPDCALFGITQGGVDMELRRAHVEELSPMPFDGFAIGGLSVGEAKHAMYDTVEAIAPQLPNGRPRYLMGVGTPRDIVECVKRGIDMFDCVLPTRNARNGQVFSRRGRLVVKHSRWRRAEEPIDEACPCYTCQTYSMAYLRHLFVCREVLSAHLLTLHNLQYYLDLVRELRQAIREGRLDEHIDECEAGWARSDRGP